MKIAIIGSGRLGGTLRQGWQDAGHVVVVGSRHPAVGDGFLPIAAAAADAEVVVNATPGAFSLDLFSRQPEAWLDDRILLDVSNADDGEGNRVYPNDSLAERLQVAYPRAHVVKSLNTFNRTVMVNPGLLPYPTTVFVSGDDLGAKTVVISLLHELGWTDDDILDLGALKTARATEAMIGLYYAVRDAVHTRDFNVRVVSAAETPEDAG